MQVFDGYREARLRSPTVAIGVFDGVHRGHSALVAEAQRLAAGGTTAVLTFEPHPQALLAPERAPRRLTPRSEKLRLLQLLGVDAVVVQPFHHEFASLDARAFWEQVLRTGLDARGVVVGYDFAFGRDRGGNADSLRRLAAETNEAGTTVRVSVVEPVRIDGEICSSTRIRKLVKAGELVAARRLLGRSYGVVGPVIPGAARGRQIGFPTANVDVGEALRPGAGVYAVRVWLGDGRAVDGVANVGTAPTFRREGPVTVEAHLFDFDEDLYGSRIRVDFVQRLRAERAFEGVDALVGQIRQDAEEAHRVLDAHDDRVRSEGEV